MNKRNLIIVLVVVLFAAAVYMVWAKKQAKPVLKNPVPDNSQQANPAPGERFDATAVKDGTFPVGITKDMVLEKNPQVLENRVIMDKETSFSQSNYVYKTSKTIKDNFTGFKKLIASKKWTITSSKDDPTFKEIVASDGRGYFHVVLDYKTDPKNSTVGLYYLYKVDPKLGPPGV